MRVDFVVAEDAPVGVQLWPSLSPKAGPSLTLESVEVVSRKIRETNDGTWYVYTDSVTWTYQDGHQERYTISEKIDVDFEKVALDRRAKIKIGRWTYDATIHPEGYASYTTRQGREALAHRNQYTEVS